jgi:uncharacterized protein YndB with AHSA1/START domain
VIRWPEDRKPEKSAVHVRNELEMPASPEVVWSWLVRAALWPTWYPNSQNVVIEGGGHDLRPGSKFRWKTFGITLDSEVEEFVPSERLAWSALDRRRRLPRVAHRKDSIWMSRAHGGDPERIACEPE